MSTVRSETLEARRDDASLAVTAAYAASFAAAIALAAQLRIPLPFTPVPITLQTLVLYLGAGWLGRRAALAGLALYVAAALAGVPVMSGWRGGLVAFSGATGGYIVGWFLAMAMLTRWLPAARSWRASATLLAAASAVILFCGALHLALLLHLMPWQAFLQGIAPFLPGDSLKILAASAALRRWPGPEGAR